METKKIEVVVTKEVHEIGVAVKGVISAYKEATKDGFQAGQDIPAVLMASYSKLTEAIEGADKVGGELKEEPVKAAMGALIPLSEGVELLMEKKEDAAE
jgi:hypothetical protein